jgi:hypothetical protein
MRNKTRKGDAAGQRTRGKLRWQRRFAVRSQSLHGRYAPQLRTNCCIAASEVIGQNRTPVLQQKPLIDVN